MVPHACDPSYSIGWSKRIMSLRPAWSGFTKNNYIKKVIKWFIGEDFKAILFGFIFEYFEQYTIGSQFLYWVFILSLKKIIFEK
jgi:hypothetical protein